MIVLITGLPGSGKTTISQEIQTALAKHKLTVELINADQVRESCNDWDFSQSGRQRQAWRMRQGALASTDDIVICDFVAPTNHIRGQIDPDYVIWMDTISSSRYPDTDAVYQPPMEFNYRVSSHADHHVAQIVDEILRTRKNI